MISTQLDLFGGPPKPPKNIREEEPAVVMAPLENKAVESANEQIPEILEDSSGEMELDVDAVPFHEEMPEWIDEPVMETETEMEKEPDYEPYEDVMGASLEEYVPEIEDEAEDEPDDADNTLAESISEIEEQTGTESEPEKADSTFEEPTPEIEDANDTEFEPDAGDSILDEPTPEIEDATETASQPETIDEYETPLDVEDVQENEETPLHPFMVEVITTNDVIISADAEVDVEDDNTEDAQEAKEGQLQIPEDEKLFLRQYYTMRETSNMFGVNQSLLRYWENEFDVLKPKKNRKGDRYFRPEDIKNLELIYHLLKVRKFTIEGAREYIKSKKKVLDTFELVQRLEKLKFFLHELKTHL